MRLTTGVAAETSKVIRLGEACGVRIFYSVQSVFALAKVEASVWMRIRLKRVKVSDANQLLTEKKSPMIRRSLRNHGIRSTGLELASAAGWIL
jgi:hypothetical protein